MADRAAFLHLPPVSVVMTVYNAGPYVAEAIASILAQTYAHFEFIIVDGGSTDGSAAVLAEFAGRDARIRPVFMPSYCNMSRALNIGVEMARGEWIAYMEADNISVPERFAIQLNWMRQSGVEIGGSLAWIFGAENRLFWFPESHAATRNYLLFCCAMLQTTMLIRAEIAKKHLFDEDAVFQDYEMWTRLAPHYRMGNLQQVLVKYRRHPQQHSKINADLDHRDQCKFRRRYFHTLFPEATWQEYAAFDHIVERESFSNLVELERAGNWLVRLAETPDNFLRRQFAGRWLAACLGSAHLGLGCYHVHQQLALQLGGAPAGRVRNRLWLMCALRIASDSRWYTALQSVKRKMTRLQAAGQKVSTTPRSDSGN